MVAYVSSTKERHSPLPVVLFILAAAALYGFAAFSFIDLIDRHESEIETAIEDLNEYMPVIEDALPFIGLFVAILFILSLLLSYGLLKLMRHTAATVTVVIAFIVPIIFILIGVVLIATVVLAFVGLMLILVGLLLLGLAYWGRQRLRRAGKFLEFSAHLALDEKAILGAPVLMAIFSVISLFAMGISFLEIYDLWGVYVETDQYGRSSTELDTVGAIIAMLIEYCFLILYFGIYYVLSGFVVSYAYDWYRDEIDPDIKTAWRDVKPVIAIILGFAVIRATIQMLLRFLRRMTTSEARAGRGGVALFFAISYIVSAFAASIFRFFTYFALPAIVIKKKGLRQSIKDSADLVWENWLQVLIGDIGLGLALLIFAIANGVSWAVLGIALGYFILQTYEWAIIMGVIFLIFSFVAFTMIRMPLSVAFSTFLYAYALDRREGFKKPSRLPQELRDEFNARMDHYHRYYATRTTRGGIPNPRGY
ncbi:MAG: DUF6159 family protein [Candidatus Hodarchaeota archaeon]